MELILRGLVAGALVLVAGALWARGRYVVITVSGTSMTPTLADGDRVLVRRRRLGQLSRGDVVVLEPPLDPGGRYEPGPAAATGGRWNIKRVAALPGDPVPAGIAAGDGVSRVPSGMVVVLGDNQDSVDSRQWGFFPTDRLLGVALRQLGGPAL
ncbi:S26 family signal peptidase [Streptosporangium lutulentum]|uniref:Signal peptidase I n=1 Tax=Streptosporangium lutulentum TaxID=1461250 RepID=A0ABT9QBA4_9ACTN|nr:S26 family signal peptidase [Streptosporangium lutulentum]MDP9844061.1 signal peptidase I [Streptosporangium lutulentum]